MANGERTDIERMVRLEQEIVSVNKQLDTLRADGAGRGVWLQKLELSTGQNSGDIRYLDQELKELHLEASSMREALTQLHAAFQAERVKITLVISGIGVFTGILSSLLTAIVLAKVLG